MFPLLTSPMTVGRAESADICVDEALVSKLHARIERVEARPFRPRSRLTSSSASFCLSAPEGRLGAARLGTQGLAIDPRDAP